MGIYTTFTITINESLDLEQERTEELTTYLQMEIERAIARVKIHGLPVKMTEDDGTKEEKK